jgi:rare lipoprotein A (peptidoglycan hydrolase)
MCDLYSVSVRQHVCGQPRSISGLHQRASFRPRSRASNRFQAGENHHHDPITTNESEGGSMKNISIATFIFLLTFTSANAAGWGSIHKYVKRSGNCSGQEILASWYATGKRTASGERFNVNGNTAAARTWPIGTTLTVTNPNSGRSVSVRVNDTGPWGISYRMGARLDLAKGAAQRIGMNRSQYVCVA